MLVVVCSFFLTSALFVLKVLAMVIAASSEGFPLDAHLSIAQALSLPVFQSARTSVRGFSCGQESVVPSSSSPPRGRGYGSSESRGGKRNASSC